MEGNGEQQHPSKFCVQCGEQFTKAGFAKRQWKRDEPICRSCAEGCEASERCPTKACFQCGECREKDQFPKKQWKRGDPVCRLCFEYANVSDERKHRCRECKSVLPRIQFDMNQWAKGDDAQCHDCRDLLQDKIQDKIQHEILGTKELAGIKELSDGTALCSLHSRECCDVCMVDYTLPNQFARKRALLGRDLTNDEVDEISQAFWEGANVSRKICIMDGQPMCPRSGRKLRCPCNEVTYCSKGCQRHHWAIHKMTCKAHTKSKKEKKHKKKQATVARWTQPPTHGLTEEQLNDIRIEAFFAENSGAEHSIEECAWQLGEHPLVIGGGSVKMSANGQRFIKGDVAKIYRENMGAEWDGSPRFGLGPYVQQKRYFDWIAKARQGKSQQEKEIEKFLRGGG
ncbi:hypothetical protein ACHAWF_001463 [Thalassiosira exigua]